MKIILTLAALMLATASNAQVAVPTKFELIPAVRTTVEIRGESYVIARDENDKIIFVNLDSVSETK